VIYMILTMTVIGLVVLLEATPTYIYFTAGMKGRPISTGELAFIAGSFALVVIVLAVAALAPMKIGLKWIDNMELG